MSYVYVLDFPDTKAIKIGKADNIYKRANELYKDWGRVDYKASLALKVKASTVHKIEKSLHRFFADYNIPFKSGDGHTEFFIMSCKPFVSEHCHLYSCHNSESEFFETLKESLLNDAFVKLTLSKPLRKSEGFKKKRGETKFKKKKKKKKKKNRS